MKKLFTTLSIILFLINATAAQIKAPSKPDTSKTKHSAAEPGKPGIKIDTVDAKLPIESQFAQFDKNDSANLKLSPVKKAPLYRYGFIDTADLKIKACDFEKDANAMVLFDRAEFLFSYIRIVMLRQRRIKIFNENGKSEANIRIEYDNRFGAETIEGLEAETINWVNGKAVYTRLDPKLIYSEHTDKSKDAVIFSFPEAKAGSIIEYKYVWSRPFSRSLPGWNFQCDLPTRYSQATIVLNPTISSSVLFKNDQPFVKDTSTSTGLGHVWAMASIPSLKDEPYMRSKKDITQSLSFIIQEVAINGVHTRVSASWADVGQQIADEKDINKPFDQNLRDEDDLIKQAKALPLPDDRVAFLYNQVKTLMKWNDEKNWASKDGIKNAWKKKSGNWGEINMILYHLLKRADVKAYPMLVSTRDNGQLRPDFVDIYQINKLVTYVPVDSTRYYVLDATDKYNIYNEIPFELLNSYGLLIDKEQKKYEMVFLKKLQPVKQVVFVKADVSTDGSMTGTAQIANFSYNKAINLELHKKLDEDKYKQYLTGDDNNLKITSLKLLDAEVDSLPLTQNIDFKLDLPGTDDKYIYFNPNLFTSLHNNPFISDTRTSNIDFGCSNIYSINGRYKIPPGYKVDVLPKSINLMMADKSISFKRIIAQEDDVIIVYYLINYKQSVYGRANYPDLHAYFKKMNEVLNEQIVLKKI